MPGRDEDVDTRSYIIGPRKPGARKKDTSSACPAQAPLTLASAQDALALPRALSKPAAYLAVRSVEGSFSAAPDSATGCSDCRRLVLLSLLRKSIRLLRCYFTRQEGRTFPLRSTPCFASSTSTDRIIRRRAATLRARCWRRVLRDLTSGKSACANVELPHHILRSTNGEQGGWVRQTRR